jgi:hypothetical protein
MGRTRSRRSARSGPGPMAHTCLARRLVGRRRDLSSVGTSTKDTIPGTSRRPPRHARKAAEPSRSAPPGQGLRPGPGRSGMATKIASRRRAFVSAHTGDASATRAFQWADRGSRTYSTEVQQRAEPLGRQTASSPATKPSPHLGDPTQFPSGGADGHPPGLVIVFTLASA